MQGWRILTPAEIAAAKRWQRNARRERVGAYVHRTWAVLGVALLIATGLLFLTALAAIALS